MAIGDSITLGAPGLTGSYRSQLSALNPRIVWTGRLYSLGEHEGYNGFRCDQVRPLALAASWALQPRVAIICLGTNDMNLAGQTPASTLTEVRAFAEEMLVSNPYMQHVVVCDLPGTNADSQTFNAGLAAAFAGAPAGIHVVTVMNTLVHPADYDGDATHPNTSGFVKIAARLQTELGALGLLP